MAFITPDQYGYPRITNTGTVSRANDTTIFRLETPIVSWNQPGGEQLGTLVPYTIEGVTSAEINGAPLTGNFELTSTRYGEIIVRTGPSFPTEKLLTVKLTDNPTVSSTIRIFADQTPVSGQIPSLVTVSVNEDTTKYFVNIRWTAVDFGLNSNLDTDTETITTDPAYASYYTTSPPGVGRPPEQRANILDLWQQRIIDAFVGRVAASWISLMNQVGISVGDVSAATGETPTAIRAFLLSGTSWTPFDASSKDIHWSETRNSPVGPFEIGVGGGGFALSAGSPTYIKFFKEAPYSSKQYTVTWALSRFTDRLEFYGSPKSIILNKSYNIATFSPTGGWLSGGNLKFGPEMWGLPPGGDSVTGLPVVRRGAGDTDYLYTWQYISGPPSLPGPIDQKPFVNGVVNSNGSMGEFATPLTVSSVTRFQFRLWSSDGDFPIAGTYFSDVTSVPSGFTIGGGSVDFSGGVELSAIVTLPINNIIKDSNTTFTPVNVSGGVAPYSYTVSPSLPAGLTLNTVTGTISGTPTASSPATTYTITSVDSDTQTRTGNFSLGVTVPSNINANDLSSVTSTLSNLSAQIQTIKNLLNAMPDYTTQINALVSAIQTIATKVSTISLDGTSIKIDIGDIDASLATVASKMTDIEQYQKKLKELGETTGIRMRGPYEAIGIVTLYKLLIEQANILDDTGSASPEEKAAALAKAQEYITKINELREF
jgi:hypothetical protein